MNVSEEDLDCVIELINKLKMGEAVHLDGFDYPIAMGEDGRIGFWYAGSVVDDFTFKTVVEIAVRIHNAGLLKKGMRKI